MSNSVLKSDEIVKEVFSPLIKSDIALFEAFRLSSDFGDTAFSMLYAWAEKFDYCRRFYDDLIAVTGKGINGERGFILIRNSKNISIDNTVNAILGLCRKAGIMPIFEYISEYELDDYVHAAHKNGKKAEISFSEKYSDYIYKVNDYISINGNKNKSKRGGYNFIINNYSDLKYVRYNNDSYADCIKIFNEWCIAHQCEKCYYGCDRKAFERVMDIYVPNRHIIGLSYIGTKPISFAVCEKINKNTVCCYFQKNAQKIRGLTYWLSRQILSEFDDIEYLNLCEDMGIKGLITDKTLLRPCAKIKKYTVKLL